MAPKVPRSRTWNQNDFTLIVDTAPKLWKSMFNPYRIENASTRFTFRAPLRNRYSTPAMAAFIMLEPSAPIRIPRLPPTRSTNGPMKKSENAYTPVPTPKMIPKSSLVIRSPSAPLATAKLYRPIYKNAYVMPSGNQFTNRRHMNLRVWCSGLVKKYRTMM